MEIKKGLTFTGNDKCFQGKVTVLEVDQPNNRLHVELTLSGENFNSTWTEDWNLQHTIWGFENGEYFQKDFTQDQGQDDMVRIKIEHGTASVKRGASKELIEALNSLSRAAYETVGNFNDFKAALYPDLNPIIKRHYPLSSQEVNPKKTEF